MNFNYFEGIREIIPSTHFEVDKNTFADVSISQFWDLVYRDECSCGEEKTITYKEEIGVSQEESTSIEGELGFTIQAVLTALSSKVGVKFNKVITISKKVERTRFSKFQILKCGKHEKIVYQLVSKWHVEPYKIKKRFLRSDKRIPLDSFDRNHREDIWIDSPKN